MKINQANLLKSKPQHIYRFKAAIALIGLLILTAFLSANLSLAIALANV